MIRDAIGLASETAPAPAKAKAKAVKPRLTAPKAAVQRVQAKKQKPKPQKFIGIRGTPMTKPRTKYTYYPAPALAPAPATGASTSHAQPKPKPKHQKPPAMPAGRPNPALAALGAEVLAHLQAIEAAHPLPAAEAAKLPSGSPQLHAMHLQHSGGGAAAVAARALAARVRAAVGEEAVQQWMQSAHTVLRAVFFAAETDRINSLKYFGLERQARAGNPYAREEMKGLKKFNKACSLLVRSSMHTTYQGTPARVKLAWGKAQFFVQ